MGFLTDSARTDYVGDIFCTLDNSLYQNEKGELEYVPSFLETDFYSRPLGNKSKFDPRPAWHHDLKCYYKQRVIVTVPVETLIEEGFLYEHWSNHRCRNIRVCKDLPSKYLKIENVTKWEADCVFKEHMKSLNINPISVGFYRLGVVFNAGWLVTGKEKLNKKYFHKKVLRTRPVWKSIFNKEGGI